MSDAVSRRSNAVESLLRNIRESKQGWTLGECVEFLVKRYSYGIRRRTAVDIVRELVELRVLYNKGTRFYVKKG